MEHNENIFTSLDVVQGFLVLILKVRFEYSFNTTIGSSAVWESLENATHAIIGIGGTAGRHTDNLVVVGDGEVGYCDNSRF